MKSNKSELRLLSFNVLAPVWIDNTLRKSVEHKTEHLHKTTRINKHIELLKKLKPDIVFFQEITPSMLKTIKNTLPEYHVPGCFIRTYWENPDTKTKYAANGNAIIWKKGLFKGSAKCTDVILDKKSGNHAAMVTGVMQNGKLVKLLSIHLEWNDPIKASRQFRRIFKNGIVKSANKRVVIAGDFNMGDHNTKSYPIISDITHHSFDDVLNGAQTHPFTDLEYKSVSHILIKNAKVSQKGVGTAKNVKQCIQKFGSDHFPIFTDIKFVA